MDEKLQTLKKWIEASGNIVFFGGAGVSTESGMADFRSVDGLYSQKYAYPPETMVSHTFFVRHPEEFYAFYKEKLLPHGAVPNAAHHALAKLEREGRLRAVVTQNCDGLHQAAGSVNVLELHGSVHRNYCLKCGKKYGLDAVESAPGVPRCNCGGTIRPDVVLYEEGLNQAVMDAAARAIAECDMLIVGGTSLVVYPAAGLVDLYRGKRLALINKSETGINSRADLVITDSIGEVLGQVAGGS